MLMANGCRNVSLGATPDIYEKPFRLLNFNMDKKLVYGLNLKLGCKNILDSEYQKTYEFKGNEYTHIKHKRGRAYSLGLSVNF